MQNFKHFLSKIEGQEYINQMDLKMYEYTFDYRKLEILNVKKLQYIWSNSIYTY